MKILKITAIMLATTLLPGLSYSDPINNLNNNNASNSDSATLRGAWSGVEQSPKAPIWHTGKAGGTNYLRFVGIESYTVSIANPDSFAPDITFGNSGRCTITGGECTIPVYNGPLSRLGPYWLVYLRSYMINEDTMLTQPAGYVLFTYDN